MNSLAVKSAAGLMVAAAVYAGFVYEPAASRDGREQRLEEAFRQLHAQPAGSFRIVPEQEGVNEGGAFKLVIKKALHENAQTISQQGAVQKTLCAEFQVIAAKRSGSGQLMITHMGLNDHHYAVDVSAKTLNVDQFNPSFSRRQTYCQPQ